MSAHPPARPNDERLADLLDDYLIALQGGTAPPREEFVARHPEFATDLRHCLSNLELLDAAARPADREPPAGAAGDSAGLGVLGDFRIIREIARGGMGVVYEAQQLSLGRRVALKVLPFATTLDAKQLRRFQHEAQAAAQLHHSNIVPVFAVGCERGTHFYAMQYIDGRSLASLIGELRELGQKKPSGAETVEPLGTPTDSPGVSALSVPLSATPVPSGLAPSTEHAGRGREFFLAAARLGVQAAEALGYAHEQGVVHRDVKPDNLLVDVHGNLWVTDFGLAQVQNNVNLTLTGDLVGTLRYMSPEQALAKRVDVDHRTDLYSLGATLYELVTLEYAFDGRDREELLRQIAFEEPRPPRRVCKGVPAELETIILKAMRKNPAERYATAHEMADDLRRFLDDRPIRARRPTPVERLAKWCRRHRVEVMAATAVTLVVVAAWLASDMLVAHARIEADMQRRIADLLRRQAAIQARTARAAVDQLYDQAEEWLDDRPPAEAARRGVLEKTVNFYDGFAHQPSSHPDARFEMAIAYLRIGRIRRALDQRSSADTAYQEARALLEGLIGEFPAEAKYRAALAVVCRCHGQVADRLPPKQKEQLAREALALAEALVREAPAVPDYRAELAACHRNLGAVLLRAGRWPYAESSLRSSAQVYEKLKDDFPAESRYRHGLAGAQSNLAVVYASLNRPAEAEKCNRDAVELLDQLKDEFPTRSRHRELLAACLVNLGSALTRKQRFTEAGDCLRRSAEVGRQLVADFAGVPAFRSLLAEAHQELAKLARHQHQRTEARREYERVLELRRQLAAEFPGQPEHAFGLVQLRLEWTAYLLEDGQPAEADQVVKDGIDFWRKCLKLGPEDFSVCPMLESLYQTQARVFLALGQHGSAARVVADRLTPSPMAAQMFWERALLMMNCARAAANDSRLTELERRVVAGEYTGQARQLVGRARQQWDKSPPSTNNLAWQLATCAEKELRDPRRAVELAQAAVDAAPKTGTFWNTLGAAHYRAGDWAAARTALEKSCALRNDGDGFDWFFLAMTCHQQKQAKEARHWYDRAVASMKEGRLRDPELDRLRTEAAQILGVP